ncbi:hypothetical protein HK101_008713 [Irineochytrium annulatum]|nr:hypothetical protein HK101_008713 [Irineochytrium annulatum]
MTMDSPATYASANAAFVDGEYSKALELFNGLVNADPANYDYLLKRSATHSQLGDSAASIADVRAALALSPVPVPTSVDDVGQLNGWPEWVGRSMVKMGKEMIKSGRAKDAVSVCAVAGVVGEAFEGVASQVKALAEDLRKKGHTVPVVSSSKPAAIPPAAPYLPPAKIRHEWFQNENFVTISIFIKQVKPEQVSINYARRAVSVTVKLPTRGTDYTLELDPLAHEITEAECKHSVLSTKIEIKLKKEVVGIRWGTLEGEEQGVVQTMADINGAGKGPSYPSSSKKKQNWDAVAKSVDEEKPEGEAALNTLFQQIYKDASEDTRRAMMKSYVESNGTCLSTNWDEVSKGKVETQPPDGMIAKKFEQ